MTAMLLTTIMWNKSEQSWLSKSLASSSSNDSSSSTSRCCLCQPWAIT
jgi:hypothetical protein